MNKKIRMSNWKKVIIEYMKNNSKEYILVMLIFIIGILLGVMVINNTSTENSNNIITYISNFIDRFKTTENIDTYGLLAESIKSNVILAIIVWFAGTTIIGMPVVLGIILFNSTVLEILKSIKLKKTKSLSENCYGNNEIKILIY